MIWSALSPLSRWAAICLLVFGIAVSGARALAGPVVVELYTSQGCSTCPPADAVLTELAGQDDIIALSIHVNYWDYLGWRDVFATDIGTKRQQQYGWALKQRYVYTPEMVFHGLSHAPGHRPAEVAKELDAARAAAEDDLPLNIARNEGGALTVTIPASEAQIEATVYMMLYDLQHRTEIARGENSGRTLTYTNVVRIIRPVGSYLGRSVTLSLPIGPGEDVAHDRGAVVVQRGGYGEVIGAASFDLREGPSMSGLTNR